MCQTYDNVNNANPYLLFVTNVDVINGDNYNTGAGVNQGCRTPQNETTIAVNPANPLNLVAETNDYRDCYVVSAGTYAMMVVAGYMFLWMLEPLGLT